MESSLGLGSEKATGPGGSSSSQGTGFSPASALFPLPSPLLSLPVLPQEPWAREKLSF